MTVYTISLFSPKALYIFKHTVTYLDFFSVWICLYCISVIFCLHEQNLKLPCNLVHGMLAGLTLLSAQAHRQQQRDASLFCSQHERHKPRKLHLALCLYVYNPEALRQKAQEFKACLITEIMSQNK